VTTTTNITSKWYATDNTAGADLAGVPQTISVTTAPEYPAPKANLGDLAVGNNGSLWLYVQASTTVTANNLVGIDVNFAANNLTASMAASLKYTVGVAAMSATLANSGDYFWACTRALGGLVLNVLTTATGNAALSGTALYVAVNQPGAVMSTALAVTASATNGLLKNIYLNSTVTGTTVTVDAVMPYCVVTSI
jgi:hypothetical protein